MSTQPSLIDLTSPRDVGDILSGAFRLYRTRFWLFAAIAFAVAVPGLGATLGLLLLSAELVSGQWWRIFGIALLIALITLSFALAGTLLFFARPRRSAQALRRGPSRAAASRRARSPRSARRRSSPSG